MPRKTTVVVQIETWLPRKYEKGGEVRLTKKRYLQWVSVGRWPVLYHDREIIFIRQFGVYATYYKCTGNHTGGFLYRADHPKAKTIPGRPFPGGWRIHPASLARLKRAR